MKTEGGFVLFVCNLIAWSVAKGNFLNDDYVDGDGTKPFNQLLFRSPRAPVIRPLWRLLSSPNPCVVEWRQYNLPVSRYIFQRICGMWISIGYVYFVIMCTRTERIVEARTMSWRIGMDGGCPTGRTNQFHRPKSMQSNLNQRFTAHRNPFTEPVWEYRLQSATMPR